MGNKNVCSTWSQCGFCLARLFLALFIFHQRLNTKRVGHMALKLRGKITACHQDGDDKHKN